MFDLARVIAKPVGGARRAASAFGTMAADAVVKRVTAGFTAASDSTVVDTIFQVIGRSLDAVVRSQSGAVVIWRGIFTNDTNHATLRFILDHLPELFRFLYDLVKPGNVIPEDNAYNELDVGHAENRTAVMYQVQRVALTLVTIVKMGRRPTPPGGLGDLQMNMSLSYDSDSEPTHVSWLEDKQSPPNEKWLFINGIANEYTWFKRSCDKIRDTFARDVKGIYNRSDGILWDLIECCGEHNAVRTNRLIERTQSSLTAQGTLERELKANVWEWNVDENDQAKVVMIAHSQGCLLLRMALQTLVNESSGDRQRREKMLRRLRVFTFGNPSIDWRVMDNGMERSLSNFVNVTEHFAHERDFVAMLGVVTHRRDQHSGYDQDSVFYSNGGRGHLFGAHYPLSVDAYVNERNSRLLEAVNGGEMA